MIFYFVFLLIIRNGELIANSSFQFVVQIILILNEQLAKMLTLPKTVGEMLLVSASQVLTHHFAKGEVNGFRKRIW